MFIQTDPAPFYFQHVENKLVLFLFSVAVTTRLLFFLFFLAESEEAKGRKHLFNIYLQGDGYTVFACLH